MVLTAELEETTFQFEPAAGSEEAFRAAPAACRAASLYVLERI
jgi:hypothetical protein